MEYILSGVNKDSGNRYCHKGLYNLQLSIHWLQYNRKFFNTIEGCFYWYKNIGTYLISVVFTVRFFNSIYVNSF